MIPGLEEMLLSHARQNKLRHIDVGMMTSGDRIVFTATGHWHKIANEIPCAQGHGESVTDAFGKMIDIADAARAAARAIQGAAA